MSATQTYIESLKSYPRPSADDLHDLCTALHAALIDAPETVWMNVSWEDMADVLTTAVRCIENDEFD